MVLVKRGSELRKSLYKFVRAPINSDQAKDFQNFDHVSARFIYDRLTDAIDLNLKKIECLQGQYHNMNCND